MLIAPTSRPTSCLQTKLNVEYFYFQANLSPSTSVGQSASSTVALSVCEKIYTRTHLSETLEPKSVKYISMLGKKARCIGSKMCQYI